MSQITTVSRTRPVIVLNPCATTVTTFGVIVGSKAVPQYDAGGGVMMDEMLCRDEEHSRNTARRSICRLASAVPREMPEHLLEEEVEEVVMVNDPPQLVLYGKPVVELTAGSPWLICLPGTPAGDVCDRGVDEMASFDPIAVPESEYDPDNRGRVRSRISSSECARSRMAHRRRHFCGDALLSTQSEEPE